MYRLCPGIMVGRACLELVRWGGAVFVGSRDILGGSMNEVVRGRAG